MAAWIPWMVFGLVVAGLMAIDLGVVHRSARSIGLREAVFWSAVWVVVSLVFGAGVYFWRGPDQALEYLTCYVLEKSLSVDNIFLFVVIFRYAGVLPEFQHKVLYWGVCGALVLRALFLLVGIELVAHFHWVLYVFGTILVVSGVNLLRNPHRDFSPARSRLYRLVQKFVPLTEHPEGTSFFVRRGHRTFATPLFLTLLMIETTDVIFATDSIPAVFSVTQDPLILFSSNAFAVLGLRALYFLLAHSLLRLRYLPAGLSLVLVFIGTKMLIARWFRIPTHWALFAILAALSVAALASWSAGRKDKRALSAQPTNDGTASSGPPA